MIPPNHFDFIVKMGKAFLAIMIAIYAFKLGRTVYWMINNELLY